MTREAKNKIAIFIFAFPALFLFTIVVFIPIIQSTYRSLFDWNGLTEPLYIGLRNYADLFKDKDFYVSLINGLIFAATLLIYQVGLGSLIAILISNKKLKGQKLYRISFFLPVVLSVTVVCQLWLSIYNGQFGLLNKVFEALGIAYRQDWLGSTKQAIYAVSFVDAWHYIGYHIIIFYTAIKGIPDHYYEAARIDGASPFQITTKITIPLLSETYKTCLILALTSGLKGFEQMFIMTGGGPGTATHTLTMLMYKSMFRLNDFGYGCAIATILLIQCLIVTYLINKYVAREGTA